MRHFDTLNEAIDQEIADDRYCQNQIALSQSDVEALLAGKVLYDDFDDKSCIITLRG